MNPAVEWVSSPRRPSDDLPSRRPARSSGSEHRSSVAPEDELAGVEHERLALLGLDQGREVVLAHRRVDVGVAGVVEDPEQVVQPDIDARRLDQAFLERIDAKSPRGDFGTDVAIGEQHATSVAAEVLAFVITGVSQTSRCSSMAEHQLPKLNTRVRFPSSAPHLPGQTRFTRRPTGRRSRDGPVWLWPGWLLHHPAVAVPLQRSARSPITRTSSTGEPDRHGVNAVDQHRRHALDPPRQLQSRPRQHLRQDGSRASTRARFAPRQKCVPPPPNATCGFGVRLTSTRSGSVKWVSSRLADG